MTGNLVAIGIDTVEIGRFAAVIARRSSVVERLFTPAERAYAARLTSQAPALAGRFAAKEATMKALGVGIGAIGWADVEVARSPSGSPHLVVTGRAAALAARRGIGGWLVSITHTATSASAVVAGLA